MAEVVGHVVRQPGELMDRVQANGLRTNVASVFEDGDPDALQREMAPAQNA